MFARPNNKVMTAALTRSYERTVQFWVGRRTAAVSMKQTSVAAADCSSTSGQTRRSYVGRSTKVFRDYCRQLVDLISKIRAIAPVPRWKNIPSKIPGCASWRGSHAKSNHFVASRTPHHSKKKSTKLRGLFCFIVIFRITVILSP